MGRVIACDVYGRERYISQSALSCVLEVDNCRNSASVRLYLGEGVTLALGEATWVCVKAPRVKGLLREKSVKGTQWGLYYFFFFTFFYITFLFLESWMIV